jgi:hypothetical protein
MKQIIANTNNDFFILYLYYLLYLLRYFVVLTLQRYGYFPFPTISLYIFIHDSCDTIPNLRQMQEICFLLCRRRPILELQCIFSEKVWLYQIFSLFLQSNNRIDRPRVMNLNYRWDEKNRVLPDGIGDTSTSTVRPGTTVMAQPNSWQPSTICLSIVIIMWTKRICYSSRQ